MTELYSILTNCNETIFKLNPTIAKSGFELIKIQVPELEKKFKFLFRLPEKYDWKGTIGYPNGKVTDTFFNAFQSAHFIDDYEREYIIVLKSNIGHIDIEEGDDFGFKRFSYIETFTNKLINNLRIMKEGDIEIGCFFTFDNITNDGSLYSVSRALYTDNILELSDEDVVLFKNNFFQLNIENPLAKKMKIYFDQSFSLKQSEVRYILLVTALESVLNSGKEQITHTFSRHLSLIISSHKDEFQNNYKRIKTLYDYRSKMVHGSDYKKELLDDYCKELREYARKTIFFLNQINAIDNKQLFEILNIKGFE